MSPSNLQVRVIANDGSLDGSSATSSNFAVDNIKPTASITYSSNDPQKAGSVLTITATYSEDMADTPISKIIISGANTLSATNMIKDTATVYTYDHTVGLGDGNATVSLSVGTDLFGNVVVATPTSGATFAVDNTAPIISISDPSSILTKSGPITYTVTYTNADSISLVVGNITLNKTGTANGTISLSGVGNSRTITVSAITGDGTLGVSIAAGTAADVAGNTSLGLDQEDTIVIDNTIPVITRVGKAIVKIYKDTTYADAGANASDNIDGNVTANIIVDGLPINTAITGTYEVSYDVSDTVGNNATQIVRTINVLEVPAQSQVLGNGVTASPSIPAVVIGDNDTTLQTIAVPSSVTNAKINVSAITVSTENSTSVSMPSALNIDVDTTLGTVSMGIPSGIEMVAQSNS
ncbi:MAG: immunoglobulin-like domain-containing protein [Candidatus Paceibacterota bacterium]